MNERILKRLIKQRFGGSVAITSLRKKHRRRPMWNNKPISWRKNLIAIFTVRLENIRMRGDDQPLVNETQQFLDDLEKLPDDSVLYIWKAESLNYKYGGWACEEKIIYARKHKRGIEPKTTR